MYKSVKKQPGLCSTDVIYMYKYTYKNLNFLKHLVVRLAINIDKRKIIIIIKGSKVPKF